jgi:hypothetical protein
MNMFIPVFYIVHCIFHLYRILFPYFRHCGYYKLGGDQLQRQKIPKHVTIFASSINESDLSSLILWSFEIGIQYLTFLGCTASKEKIQSRLPIVPSSPNANVLHYRDGNEKVLTMKFEEVQTCRDNVLAIIASVCNRSNEKINQQILERELEGNSVRISRLTNSRPSISGARFDADRKP